MLKNNNIDFFAVLNMKNRRAINKKKMVIIGAAAFAVVINFGVMAYFIVGNSIKQDEIEVLTEFMEGEYVATSMKAQNDNLKNIEVAKLDITLYEKFRDGRVDNSGFFSVMHDIAEDVKPEDVSITSFSYKDRTLTLKCETLDDDRPADYAKTLEQTRKFQTVTYRGFSEGEEIVSFEIVCVVKSEVFADE